MAAPRYQHSHVRQLSPPRTTVPVASYPQRPQANPSYYAAPAYGADQQAGYYQGYQGHSRAQAPPQAPPQAPQQAHPHQLQKQPQQMPAQYYQPQPQPEPQPPQIPQQMHAHHHHHHHHHPHAQQHPQPQPQPQFAQPQYAQQHSQAQAADGDVDPFALALRQQPRAEVRTRQAVRQEMLDEFRRGLTTVNEMWDKKTLFDMVIENRLAGVQERLAQGSDPNECDVLGRTALHKAARRSDSAIIHELIRAGADVNAKDDDGKMPIAFAWEKGNAEALKALRENGAEVFFQDDKGRTMMHHAAREGREDLLDAVYHPESIETPDDNGNLPVHIACAKGHDECVRFLVQHDTSLDLENRVGFTALQLAVCSKSESCVRELVKDRRLDLTDQNKDGDSALHLAAANGDEMVEVLVEAAKAQETSGVLGQGSTMAYLNLRNKNGDTAMHVAASTGHAKAVQLLLDHDAAIVKNEKGQTAMQITKMGHGELQGAFQKVDVRFYHTTISGDAVMDANMSRLKTLLDAKNVKYDEINLAMEPHRKRELVETTDEEEPLPQLFVNNLYVGGYADLQCMEDDGVFDKLLQGHIFLEEATDDNYIAEPRSASDAVLMRLGLSLRYLE